MVTVGVRDEDRFSPEGKYSVAPRKARQDQARQEQQPQQQQSGKSGTERTRDNTPERESRRNGNGNGNRYPGRSGSVSPGRDDYRPLVRGLVVRVAVEMAMVMDTSVQVLPIVTVVVPHQVRGLETLEVRVQGQGTLMNRIKGHIHLEGGWPGHINHGLGMEEHFTPK